MDKCGICYKAADQLFETSNNGVFACFKCQPLVPEVTLDDTSSTETFVKEEGLACGICHKAFQKNVQLQNHLRNHRAERRFVCTFCNKAFSQSNNLRAHLRIHTNERPYKCSECGKAFTQVTNLNNHFRLHTGERPFVCPEPGCNKAYAQVTNLNQHRKRHLNGRSLEQSYDCKVCGEQFEQRIHLYSHRREMHGDYQCSYCQKRFNSEKQLVEHIPEHLPNNEGKREAEMLKCVFSSCGEQFCSARQHTEHLLLKHQLRVLAAPSSPSSRTPRGRPRKVSKLGDTQYEVPIERVHMKDDPLYIPKLKVQNMFQ